MKRLFLSLLAATALVSMVALPALSQVGVAPAPTYFSTPFTFVSNFDGTKVLSTTAPVIHRQLGFVPFSNTAADTSIALPIASSWARSQARSAAVTSAADTIPLGYFQIDAIDSGVDTIGVVVQVSSNGVTWTAVDSLNFGPTAAFVLGDTTRVTPAPASGTSLSSGRVYINSICPQSALTGYSRVGEWKSANFVRIICSRDISSAGAGNKYAAKFALYTPDPLWMSR